MSDITHSRRAVEFIDRHEDTDHPLPGENPIKAGVHASLASARALREIDSTTRQVNRLTADSIDELARDVVNTFRRAPLLVKLGDTWINPLHIAIVRQHNTSTVISLTSGDVAAVEADVDEVVATLLTAVA